MESAVGLENSPMISVLSFSLSHVLLPFEILWYPFWICSRHFRVQDVSHTGSPIVHSRPSAQGDLLDVSGFQIDRDTEDLGRKSAYPELHSCRIHRGSLGPAYHHPRHSSAATGPRCQSLKSSAKVIKVRTFRELTDIVHCQTKWIRRVRTFRAL